MKKGLKRRKVMLKVPSLVILIFVIYLRTVRFEWKCRVRRGIRSLWKSFQLLCVESFIFRTLIISCGVLYNTWVMRDERDKMSRCCCGLISFRQIFVRQRGNVIVWAKLGKKFLFINRVRGVSRKCYEV